MFQINTEADNKNKLKVKQWTAINIFPVLITVEHTTWSVSPCS